MKNIFIIGSKGIPSNYGGFETFVEKLTENQKANEIQYHVSCMGENFEEFIHNGARCFNVKVPNIGAAKAVYYDVKSLDLVYRYIKDNNINDAVVYILACRIGPFINYYKKKFKILNVPFYLNPDGHEWKRAKWNALIRKYWKFSERLMIKNSDLVICDSLAIEKYINKEYKIYNPKTTYIAYGATIKPVESLETEEYSLWLKRWNLKSKDYYLIVGRFVAENNYELIIKEFMKSTSSKNLVIITNYEKNDYYKKLKNSTNFNFDERIKFVGTVYEQDLLLQIRSEAYGYLHGHEVGGTNPSLLEAMATTSLNLLLDVEFNKEVGKESALYFNKENGDLSSLLKTADSLIDVEIQEMGIKAKKRISEAYSWEFIVNDYEKCFIKEL